MVELVHTSHFDTQCDGDTVAAVQLLNVLDFVRLDDDVAGVRISYHGH
jgi:hypothetical protein